jgi:riboflavin synthase
MFSGIIEKLGHVKSAKFHAGALALQLETGFTDLALGESVATNGVCLTVTAMDGKGSAEFFASAETLARTNLGHLREGGKVNLERAVSLNTRLSGHMVQGHVDGLATLESIHHEDGAWKLAVAIPASLSRYCVEKGSITLNGISLTINSMQDEPDGALTIGLTIIPHTWEHTNLHTAKPGDAINVEVDVMAKYVERLSQASIQAPGNIRDKSTIQEIAQSELPSAFASEPLRAHAFLRDGVDHLALVKHPLPKIPLVRVHSECLTGEALGSLRCDCGAQLQESIRLISESDGGIVVYLRDHEGRGIGLANKIMAYALQDQGHDTVEANTDLGFAPDARDYAVAADILKILGVSSLRLLSNNPEKAKALSELGIDVKERIPLIIASNPFNATYLATKRDRMGHFIPPQEKN